MGKIDELIQQYCPDGVEWKTIEEVCKVKTPPAKLKTSDYQERGAFYIIDQGQEQYAGYTDNGKAVLEDGEYILYGDHTCIVKYHKGRFAQGADGLKILTSKTHNPKYVYYALSAYNLTNTEYKRHWTQAKEIEIPLPPLPVQEEIVRILDNFTNLAAELQAELQARQQQYQYYRDTLLSFEGRDDVQWKKLGEVASIKTGRRFVRTDIRESGVPCFHYGDIYTYYGLTATKTKGYLDAELASKLRFAQPNDVVVVCAGENDMDIGVGVAWLGDEPAVIHDACCILHHEQNPRYISHFLRTHNYHLQMKRYVKNGKISSLPASGLAEALIPIPSLEEQERIANTLDRFDALTNDLTQGLPAEIEARQQQYEYYRDQLLTFKRKEA